MNPGKRLAGASATFMKGMCMGSADIVPGVSGGTMALILGIYERLLRAIRSFDKDWLSLIVKGRFGAALARNDLPFLAALGAGILAALLLAGVRNVQPRPSVGFKFVLQRQFGRNAGGRYAPSNGFSPGRFPRSGWRFVVSRRTRARTHRESMAFCGTPPGRRCKR